MSSLLIILSGLSPLDASEKPLENIESLEALIEARIAQLLELQSADNSKVSSLFEAESQRIQLGSRITWTGATFGTGAMAAFYIFALIAWGDWSHLSAARTAVAFTLSLIFPGVIAYFIGGAAGGLLASGVAQYLAGKIDALPELESIFKDYQKKIDDLITLIQDWNETQDYLDLEGKLTSLEAHLDELQDLRLRLAEHFKVSRQATALSDPLTKLRINFRTLSKTHWSDFHQLMIEILELLKYELNDILTSAGRESEGLSNRWGSIAQDPLLESRETVNFHKGRSIVVELEVQILKSLLGQLRSLKQPELWHEHSLRECRAAILRSTRFTFHRPVQSDD